MTNIKQQNAFNSESVHSRRAKVKREKRKKNQNFRRKTSVPMSRQLWEFLPDLQVKRKC